MGAFIAILYILIAAGWGRVYFARKHGVRLGSGIGALLNPGSMEGLLVGMAWPVTLFTARDPEPCTHRDHVIARGAQHDQYEADNRRYEESLRRERGGHE